MNLVLRALTREPPAAYALLGGLRAANQRCRRSVERALTRLSTDLDEVPRLGWRARAASGPVYAKGTCKRVSATQLKQQRSPALWKKPDRSYANEVEQRRQRRLRYN
jgi:hypothetical protein